MSTNAGSGSHERPAGERRQLTMLFCDIVDSTGMSERLDPEDVRDVLEDYQQACREEISRFGGAISHYAGDGMMAQFGYPVAIEKGPQAAVRAALAIVEHMHDVSARTQRQFGEPVSLRIGIQTGVVVVGDMGTDANRQSGTLVGEAANVAARLQALAPVNGIVVGDATQALLASDFELLPLGPQNLRGLRREVSAFVVVRERYRDDAVASPTRTAAFVGRDVQLAALLEQWHGIASDRGSTTLLVGDAGIGKSRLVRELRSAINKEGKRSLVLGGSVHHGNAALYPFIEYLRHVERDGAPALPPRLAALPDRELASLVEELVNPAVLAGGTRKPTPATPELRRKLHDFIVEFVLDQGDAGGQLLVIEDAHWLDPSSLEVVGRLRAAIAGRPVFMLITSRHKLPAAGAMPAPQLLSLDRLSSDDCRSIVESIAGPAVPGQVMQSILARCDGTPLFAEELALAFAATGALGTTATTTAQADSQVPPALHDSLLARLDRLGNAKAVAQQASVLGRKFRRDILASIPGTDPSRLDESLSTLATAGIIVADATAGGTFEFKHALVRDAAYQSILKGQRRVMHAEVGKLIETAFPALKELEPDLLAQHWARAGEPERSARHGLKAARMSAMRSSNVEAMAQAAGVFEQAKELPPGPLRDGIELEACIATIGPLISLKGYGAPEVATITARALELARALGGATDEGLPRILPILYCQWSHLQVTGRVREAHELATQIMTRASAQSTVPPRIVGHRLLGTSQLLLGNPSSAIQNLDAAIELYVPADHASLAYVFGTDFRVMSRCHLAFACWHVGALERGARAGVAALEDARSLEHANTLGYALTHLCLLRALERDIAGMATLARELVELSRQRELPFWGAVTLGFMGWYETCAGKPEDGLAKLMGGLSFMNKMNLVYWMPTYRTWVAEAQLAVGDLAGAEQSLAEALAVVERGDERWFESECWRVKSRIEIARGLGIDQVLRTLERSLAAASATGSRSFELRTALDIHRLLQPPNKDAWHQSSRELLERCLAVFGTGPQLADQREAAAILAKEVVPR